ncbi:hypothetical protein BDB01DRAFT_802415, partial [Pilobolus umbonatus]
MGPLSISSITFDNSSNAFASLRINVEKIRCIPFINEEEQVVRETTLEIGINTLTGRYMKLTYILFRYVWENLYDPEVTKIEAGDMNEIFADNLINLHEKLGTVFKYRCKYLRL